VEHCPAEELSARLATGAAADLLLLNLTRASLSGEHPAFLTMRTQDRPPSLALLREDQVMELDPTLGIDDFAIHPVAPAELLARVQHVLWRRAGIDARNVLRSGDLLIDQAGYKVFVGGRPVDLTYKEYELLRYLASQRDKVLTREALLNRVWGYDFYGGARTVDVHIRRLRSTLEDRNHTFIETVRNVGYRFHAG
jgi:two-component system alkaline phosphatase synthesis response regulator PhoP